MINIIRKITGYLSNHNKLARIVSSSLDDKQFPEQQVEYDGKIATAVPLFTYGIHGNMPVDTLCTLQAINGDLSNRILIGGHNADRPVMAAGEVCFYHPPTDAIIHYRASGDIDIVSGNSGSANINITAATVNVTGDATISGDATVAGNLNVTGDITAENVTANTEVTAGSVTLTGHVHTNPPGTYVAAFPSGVITGNSGVGTG